MKLASLLLLASTPLVASLFFFQSALADQEPAGKDGLGDLTRVFEENGIRLDLDRKLCSINASVAVREELLEYLLVASYGASHESLFVTKTSPSVLNTAFLALGVEPGSNARWGPKDPPPSEEEMKRGASPYDITPPKGDGFFLYAAWEADGETYFYRVEDLVRNLSTGRCMKRHRWVYLGSRMVEWEKQGELAFAAEVMGNLVNIAFFEQGDTMLTGSLPECVEQSVWMGNSWLLPDREQDLKLIFSRERLNSLPTGVLPEAKREDN